MKEFRKMQKGFSLIEMLVVLTMVGIIMIVVIPQTGRVINTMQVKGTANQLAQDLQNARERAIAQGHQVALVFTSNGNLLMSVTKYYRANDTLVVSQNKYSGCFLGLRPVNPPNTRPPDGLPAGMPDSSIEFAGNQVVFFPQGSGTPGAIYLTSKNRKIQSAVTVNMNGRVRVWRWDNGWY